MRYVIKINMDNEAFAGCGTGGSVEVARILRDLAVKLESGAVGVGDETALRDINGNNVGTAHSTKRN